MCLKALLQRDACLQCLPPKVNQITAQDTTLFLLTCFLGDKLDKQSWGYLSIKLHNQHHRRLQQPEELEHMLTNRAHCSTGYNSLQHGLHEHKSNNLHRAAQVDPVDEIINPLLNIQSELSPPFCGSAGHSVQLVSAALSLLKQLSVLQHLCRTKHKPCLGKSNRQVILAHALSLQWLL